MFVPWSVRPRPLEPTGSVPLWYHHRLVTLGVDPNWSQVWCFFPCCASVVMETKMLTAQKSPKPAHSTSDERGGKVVTLQRSTSDLMMWTRLSNMRSGYGRQTGPHLGKKELSRKNSNQSCSTLWDRLCESMKTTWLQVEEKKKRNSFKKTKGLGGRVSIRICLVCLVL